MLNFHTCIAVCLLLAASAQGRSDEPVMETRTSDARAANFIDPGALELEKKIPRPPARRSLGELADLETVLQIQARRTSADANWAATIVAGDVFSSSDIVGSWFAERNLPHVAELFGKLKEDVGAATRRAKNLYRRERPYTLSAEVIPCVEKSETYSYPSGYAVQVFVRAGVLAEMFPDKRAALFAQAHERAWARIVGGAHYPSDDVAGRLLAELFLAELRKSDSFLSALERARTEIRIHRETSGMEARGVGPGSAPLIF